MDGKVRAREIGGRAVAGDGRGARGWDGRGAGGEIALGTGFSALAGLWVDAASVVAAGVDRAIAGRSGGAVTTAD